MKRNPALSFHTGECILIPHSSKGLAGVQVSGTNLGARVSSN